jgi:hypothetical protein
MGVKAIVISFYEKSGGKQFSAAICKKKATCPASFTEWQNVFSSLF